MLHPSTHDVLKTKHNLPQHLAKFREQTEVNIDRASALRFVEVKCVLGFTTDLQ